MIALAATGLMCAPSRAADCAIVASPSGSDSASGTLAHPLKTIQHLTEALKAGQVGCVRGGVYREDLRVGHGGRNETARLTIESYGRERATLVGRLYIPRGSNFVTIKQLNLNGRNRSLLPSPTVNGNSAEFISDDVTNEHTGICFILGSRGYGRARRSVIIGNRIHDCGVLPSRNLDHGIYVAESRGARILNNVIFKNADRGIQLFPNAQETVIEHNIIDENGEGITFSGDGVASSNTTVAYNLITRSKIRYDVESYYAAGTRPGVNNVVSHNCLFGGAQGSHDMEVGYTAAGLGNLLAYPEYADSARGDYSVPTANPCARYVTVETPVAPF